MSKVWFTAVVLGLTCAVAVAKDKEKDKGKENPFKNGRGAQATPRPAERPQPAKPAPAPKQVAPTPAPKPAPAPAPAPKPFAGQAPVQKPTPAPAQKPTPAPAPAPVQKTVPAPAQKPALAPAVNPSPRPFDSGRKPADAPKAPTNSGASTNPAVPFGKTGAAFGPVPGPNNPVFVAPQRPAVEKSADQRPVASKPLPVAPKFETNKKIPPFGAFLNGPEPSNHNHGDTKTVTERQRPVITTKPVRRPDYDRDHDRHDHDDHNHHRYGNNNRTNWSLIILGGAAPVGRGWYGPGYGRTYGGWSNNTYYVPAQSYGPVQNYGPVVNAPIRVNVAPATLPQPAQTPNEDFSTLPIARQRELLLQALNALEDDFARSPNGDEWSRQLQLATTAKLIGEGDDPTEPVTRTRLRSVVELFDEVAANEDYRPVSELLSFRSLQAGLREFASEPIGQARGRLSRAADQLTQQLKTWPTGDRWKDYLQVPWLVGTEEEDQLDMPDRLVRFEKLLAKFDRVKSDDQFQVVSKEPSFGTTHSALQAFVRELRLVIEASVPEPKLPELNLPEPKLPELKLPDPNQPEPKVD